MIITIVIKIFVFIQIDWKLLIDCLGNSEHVRNRIFRGHKEEFHVLEVGTFLPSKIKILKRQILESWIKTVKGWIPICRHPICHPTGQAPPSSSNCQSWNSDHEEIDNDHLHHHFCLNHPIPHHHCHHDHHCDLWQHFHYHDCHHCYMKQICHMAWQSKLSETYRVTYQNLCEKGTKPRMKREIEKTGHHWNNCQAWPNCHNCHQNPRSAIWLGWAPVVPNCQSWTTISVQ